MLKAPIARLIAAGLLSLAAQSAPAGPVTISSQPLATAGGSSVLPNLMFVLDASGSMDSDYNGDFVNDSGKCMNRSTGSNSCIVGDPPWDAGGANAMNGVAYDPFFNYKPGLKADGTTVIADPITVSSTPNDAYGVQFTGNTNMTSGIQGVRYCNSNSVCKRNGSDNAGTTLVGGADDQGVTHPAGRFPYRTHNSNSSTLIFGLPEMMAGGTFSRSSSTVTATTIAPHGLATNDWIYVTGTGTGIDINAAQVTVTNANTFTYTSGGSGSISARQASFRKHSSGSFVRAATLVTVTSTAHGLVSNDVILVNSSANSAFNATSATVTVVDANTFTYVSGASGAIAATAGTWVRNDLYNVRGTVNGTAKSYYIIPIEYCSDANLSNCVAVAVGGTPPAGFTFPAYVRFCQTQEQALSPALVSDASGTPRCRSKFVGSGTTKWTYPRFGYFQRDIIQSSTATYARSSARTDCATAPTCTYTEEIQNYARWWAYYRTRMQMMKTAAGRAFLPFISTTSANDKLRVGFITINPFYAIGGSSNLGSVQTNRYLKIDPFRGGSGGQADKWYTMFYLQDPNQSTPLREALSRVGWIYSGKLDTGLTKGIPATDDPVEASCQRHFTLLTTDGYWNGNAGQNLVGGAIGNLDNVNPTVDKPYATSTPSVDRTTTGTFDGGRGTTVTTATPQTFSEWVVCQATSNTAFGSGTQQACGCSAGEHRIKQRDTTATVTVSTTDGVLNPGFPSTGSPTYAFSNYSGCSPAVVVTTTTTPVSITETKVCQGSNTVTFADNATQSCSCSGSRRELIRETRTGATMTTQTIDGIPQSPTYSGGTTTWAYSINGSTFQSSGFSGSSCTSSSLTAVAQNVNTSGSTNSSSTTGTALTLPTPNPSTTTVGTPTTTTVAGGYPNTLADVAMYYYRSDLRGGTDPFGNGTGPALNLGGTGTADVSANVVPARVGAKDFVTHQHMVTFTIGLADGLMRYQSDYETASAGDFANIKNGVSNGCFWVSGTCDWPQPVNDDASALDDLWHAAVNGRGQFYLALNADALSTGIQTALTAVNAQVAAAAASATSSPNVTQTDNQIFSTTYETNTWSGKVFAQTIDPATGNVSPTIQWQADGQLLAKVAAASDSRNIWTFDSTSGTLLKPFTWAKLTATEQDFFLKKCVPTSTMTQCTSLSPADLTIANDGSSLVGFLRGWTGNEGPIAGAGAFRDRTYIDVANNNAVVQTVLGDTISAKPAYLRRPQFNYADAVTPAYSTFLSANTNRSPRVYVAANDGFLHAFHGDTGEEMWAYLPRFLMPELYQLADKGYGSLHRYYADGSPETADVFDSTLGAWRTILIAGVSGGGRGYYAIDVTDPSNPKGLWEFCSDASLCDVSDPDLGLTYGNPVVGKLKDGTWVVVVTSGLNNIGTSGDGVGYFYVLDAITGKVLDKVSTKVGDTITPSGLMKISAFYDSALTDATFVYIYGGDQLGNVWRLDTSTLPATILHLATLTDGSSPPRLQPITTRPSLTRISGFRVLYIGTGRYLGKQDLSDPISTDPTISWQQTLWAFKDKDADYDATWGILRKDSDLVQQVLSQITPTDRGISTNPVDWNTKDGWYVDFNPSFSGVENSPGEGVNLVDPRLVLGTLVVTTNVPAGGGASCSVGGTSFQYNFDFKTGQAVSTSAGGVVGKSLGGTITVGVAIVQLPSGAIKSISTGADTSKTTTAVETSSTGAAVRRFSYRVR